MKRTLIVLALLGLAALAASPARARDRLASLAGDLADAASDLGKLRVAVVPLVPLDDSESVDGLVLSERLVTELVRLNRLGVVERRLVKDVMQERFLAAAGVTAGPKTVRALPPVDAIVTGSYTSDGDDLRVELRLVDVESGSVLFAESEKIEVDWRKPGLFDPPLCVGSAEQCREDRRDARRLEREIRAWNQGQWVFPAQPDAIGGSDGR